MTRSEAIDRSDPQLTAALAEPTAMLESDGFEATWEVDAANGVHFTVAPGSAVTGRPPASVSVGCAIPSSGGAPVPISPFSD